MMILRSSPVFSPRLWVSAAVLLGVGALASAASAQSSAVTAPTVITTAPYTISVSGKYILGNDLILSSTDAPAITISVANVNLDLGGYFISGAGDTTSTNVLISVGDVAGVTIKNGTLANDGAGIEFTGGSDPRDYAVAGVTLTHLYEFGVEFDNTAIAGKVYDCKFSALGGSTNDEEGFVAAIASNGGVRSEKNTIDTVTESDGETVGIASDTGDFVIDDTIANCQIGTGFCIFLNTLTTNVSTPFIDGTQATGNTSVDSSGNPNKVNGKAVTARRYGSRQR